MDAARKGDCERVGALVNEGINANAAMQLFASVMYEEGICVDRSRDKARRYYEAGIASKDWQPALEIGLSYALADVVSRSYSKAGAWLARSLEQQGKSTASEKLVLSTLPSGETTPRTEWNGYLISIYWLGSRLIKYPVAVQRSGAEGVYQVRVCVQDGTVSVTPLKVEPGPAAGVERYSNTQELMRSIESGYASAMKALPVPSQAEAPQRACFQNSIAFRLR